MLHDAGGGGAHVSPEHAEEEEEGNNHHHHYKNKKKKWSSKFAAGFYPFIPFIYSLSGYSTNKCVNIFSFSVLSWKHCQPAVCSVFRCVCVCVRAEGHALLMGVNCTEASGCRLLLHLFKRKRLKINQKGSWERKVSENQVIGLISVSPRPRLKLSCG